MGVGRVGVIGYVGLLSFAPPVPINGELTLGLGLAGILIAAWTMVVVYRLRHRGVEWIYACALIGGMLVTPYAHLDDLAMLGLAGWLVLRANPPSCAWIYILAGVAPAEGEPLWGPNPGICGHPG